MKSNIHHREDATSNKTLRPTFPSCYTVDEILASDTQSKFISLPYVPLSGAVSNVHMHIHI
jgi:hypothetical protein